MSTVLLFLPGPVLATVSKRRSRGLPSRYAPVCSVSPPQSVGIAGGGLAGLSAALFLLETSKTPITSVTVFDPRSSLDTNLGGPLNLSAASVILQTIYSIPLRVHARDFLSVTSYSIDSTLFSEDVPSLLTSTPTLTDKDGPLFMTIMRDRLQQLLNDRAEEAGVRMRRGTEFGVVGVEDGAEGVRFILEGDERSEWFDLVVGADGLRSKVRDYVLGETCIPKYMGLRLCWAMKKGVGLQKGENQQWFGDGGYILRYGGGRGEDEVGALALTSREDRVDEKGGDVRWREGGKRVQEEMRRRLRAVGFGDGEFEQFVQDADRFIETGVYYHPNTRTWIKGRCVLIGDAAHAMPPFLGQGANAAIQDSRALAVAIAKIGTDYDKLDKALKTYQEERKGVVEAILRTSGLLGYLETQKGPLGMAVRNNLFRAMGVFGLPGKVLVQSAVPRVDLEW